MLKTTMYEFNKNDDQFSDLKWLSTVKAAPGDTRDYTVYVVVKDGLAHRSDGSMMKSVQIGIEPGFYAVFKATGVLVLAFVKESPDTGTPDFGDLYNKYQGLKHKTKCDGKGSWPRVLGTVTMESKQIFDPIKFSKICDDVFGSVSFGDGEDPVLVEDDGGKKKALLMPLLS